MPVSETPDAGKTPEGGGGPAGKSLARTLGAATETGKEAYDTGANGDGGGGKADLERKRKEELPKSALDE